MNAPHPLKHLAIIPDGNRRWSEAHDIDLKRTYSISAGILDEIIDYAVAHGVEYVTVWPVSNRTWRRTRPELDTILDAVRDYLTFAAKSYPRRGYRFKTIGRMDRLRSSHRLLCEEIECLEAATAELRQATVVMAFDYNGREEIVRAVSRMLDRDQNLPDVESFKDFLDAGNIPDPDLLLRTGGDRRLSGFLPYQLEYAELVFRDELLPDFRIEMMAEIFQAFSQRRYSQ